MKHVLHVMTILEGFAGGVLLGGGMLHIIPEATEKIGNAIEALVHRHRNETVNALFDMEFTMTGTSTPIVFGGGGDDDGNDPWFVTFPWVSLLACCSLLTIYFLENVLMRFVLHFNLNPEETEALLDSNAPTNYQTMSSQQQSYQTRKTTLSLFLNALILWISLSVHSLFEGLGLGTTDNDKEMWSLFVAIMAHKFVAAFALGIIIEKGFKGMDSNKTCRNFLATIGLVLSFSIATPVGIGIGIGITESGKTQNNDGWLIAQSCLLALAAGAFLHVSLFEVLGSTHHSHRHGLDHENGDGHQEGDPHPLYTLAKFVLFLIGFAIMSILAPFT
jgi:hypothetical protein